MSNTPLLQKLGKRIFNYSIIFKPAIPTLSWDADNKRHPEFRESSKFRQPPFSLLFGNRWVLGGAQVSASTNSTPHFSFLSHTAVESMVGSTLPNFMVCKATVLQDYFYSSCMYKRLHRAPTSALKLIHVSFSNLYLLFSSKCLVVLTSDLLYILCVSQWHLYFFWHAVVFFRMLHWCKLSPGTDAQNINFLDLPSFLNDIPLSYSPYQASKPLLVVPCGHSLLHVIFLSFGNIS